MPRRGRQAWLVARDEGESAQRRRYQGLEVDLLPAQRRGLQDTATGDGSRNGHRDRASAATQRPVEIDQSPADLSQCLVGCLRSAAVLDVDDASAELDGDDPPTGVGDLDRGDDRPVGMSGEEARGAAASAGPAWCLLGEQPQRA